NLALKSDEFELSARVTLPLGPAHASDLLPLVRDLADAIVRETSKAVEATGARISCKKGCGSCCRNLVVIAEERPRRLLAFVDGLPEPRRSQIQARFADARDRLEKVGLLTRLHKAEHWTGDEYTRLVTEYFQQGIPCPFLEDESCSIYEERPV